MEPIFIGGCVRSGTTLLRSILSSHPNVNIPRETSFFQYLDKFEQRNYAHEFNSFLRYYTQTRRFTYQGVNVDDFVQKFDNSEAKDYKDILTLLMEQLAGNQGKKYWGDKTPGNEYHFERIIEYFPKSKFIYVLRNPKAVIASLQQTPWGSKNVINQIKIWKRSVEQYESIKANSAVILIKYEDLTSNPENIIRDLCDFIELDYTNTMLVNRGIDQPNNTANDWTTKYENQVSSKKIDKANNKWQDTLPAWKLRLIEEKTNKLAHKYQYDSLYDRANYMDYIKSYIDYVKGRRMKNLVGQLKNMG